MKASPSKPLAFVVATKDRPEDLLRMLESLATQTCPPDEVVIVDASRDPVTAVTSGFPQLSIRHVVHRGPPSAAGQRNVGLCKVGPDILLIGFLDDDTVLAPDALAVMHAFWESADSDLAGAAFNLMNPPKREYVTLKGSFLLHRIGLYSSRPGAVALSGWQTVVGTVEKDLYVDWLPTGAAVWRREVFDEHNFDEYYDRYSYVEDVDFSYGISRSCRLAIVAGAKYWHFHSPHGRVSAYEFGRVEVRNRIHFVRKHRLSLWRCYLGLDIRMLMSVVAALRHRRVTALQRAGGNLVTVVESLFKRRS